MMKRTLVWLSTSAVTRALRAGTSSEAQESSGGQDFSHQHNGNSSSDSIAAGDKLAQNNYLNYYYPCALYVVLGDPSTVYAVASEKVGIRQLDRSAINNILKFLLVPLKLYRLGDEVWIKKLFLRNYFFFELKIFFTNIHSKLMSPIFSDIQNTMFLLCPTDPEQSDETRIPETSGEFVLGTVRQYVGEKEPNDTPPLEESSSSSSCRSTISEAKQQKLSIFRVAVDAVPKPNPKATSPYEHSDDQPDPDHIVPIFSTKRRKIGIGHLPWSDMCTFHIDDVCCNSGVDTSINVKFECITVAGKYKNNQLLCKLDSDKLQPVVKITIDGLRFQGWQVEGFHECPRKQLGRSDGYIGALNEEVTIEAPSSAERWEEIVSLVLNAARQFYEQGTGLANLMNDPRLRTYLNFAHEPVEYRLCKINGEPIFDVGGTIAESDYEHCKAIFLEHSKLVLSFTGWFTRRKVVNVIVQKDQFQNLAVPENSNGLSLLTFLKNVGIFQKEARKAYIDSLSNDSLQPFKITTHKQVQIGSDLMYNRVSHCGSMAMLQLWFTHPEDVNEPIKEVNIVTKK